MDNWLKSLPAGKANLPRSPFRGKYRPEPTADRSKQVPDAPWQFFRRVPCQCGHETYINPICLRQFDPMAADAASRPCNACQREEIRRDPRILEEIRRRAKRDFPE